MNTLFVRRATVLGIALILVSLALYARLEWSVEIEQSQSPGEKSLGVAALGMLWGIPMLITAAIGGLSLISAAVAAAYGRFVEPSN